MALSAQELRIGNIFDYYGQVVHVMEIMELSAEFGYFTDSIGFKRSYVEQDCPQRIPLTEEWLLKLGFKKYSSSQWDRENFWNIEFKRHGCYWCNQLEIHINSVHQLQNLYFALTGEELTVNPR